jgi:hypothetical protein
MKFNAKVKVAKKPVRVVKVAKKTVAVKKTAKKPVVVKKIAKKPGVGKHYEKIAKNKSLYGRRIKQLKAITDDTNYIPKRGTTGTNLENSYHEFIFSMYGALISGRKITPKMESAITKIVKTYAEFLNAEKDPKLRKRKLDYTDSTISKLNMIKRRLGECNYTKSYTNDKLYFLESIEKQVYSRGSLSIKQRKALNGMYVQFTKRSERNEKIKSKNNRKTIREMQNGS